MGKGTFQHKRYLIASAGHSRTTARCVTVTARPANVADVGHVLSHRLGHVRQVAQCATGRAAAAPELLRATTLLL